MRSTVGALVFSLLMVGSVMAQEGVIAGSVVDGRTRQPLGGAQVDVVSRNRGTLTNGRGEFRLTGLGTEPVTIRVTMLGYRTVTQTARAGELALRLSLDETAVALDELVVTGTAGRQERKAQAAVVASINVADVVDKAPISTMVELLQGRVTSLSITPASGSTGVGQRINIRGAASISLSNEPLVFVDGVRMQGGRRAVGLSTGGSAPSALNDINPSDIESVEVVKGPAAATLYGADASGGVIQIITRKGRGGVRRFSQNIGIEYGTLRPNFTPMANYGACTAANVLVTSTSALCRGQAVGTVVADNPLVREGLLRDGQLRSFQYSGQGGGEQYGFFVSLGHEAEDGVVPENSAQRTTGRVNFLWLPSTVLRAEAGFSLARVENFLPQNEDSGYGYLLNGFFGAPTTLRPDGTGGFYTGNFSVLSSASIQTRSNTLRYTPSMTLHYTPKSWFSNRLTVGADIPRTSGFQLFPKNANGWYVGDQARSTVLESRDNQDSYTIDYLGNLSAKTGVNSAWSSDLSFGVQYIDRRGDFLSGRGVGLTTNGARVVSAAATATASQGFTRDRSLGFFLQEQLGLKDRLFLQVGARVDQNSSFGSEADAFFLPKVGVSYVLSQEPYWRKLSSFIPTLRVRAAYGTTGRAPDPGAVLETYGASPYQDLAGLIGSGVIPLNPGNTALKPERGIEFEAGFDAGLLRERIAVEFSYYNKKTQDLLLRQPQPPSLGFSSNPFVNVGEVVNSGVELALTGTIIDRKNVVWETRISGSTLHNELVELGDLQPFGNSTTGYYRPGLQLGGMLARKIRRVDLDRGVTVVSDTVEFLGNQIPTLEGTFSSTLSLFGRLRLYGQFDGKSGFNIWNANAEYRERSFRNEEKIVKPEEQGGYTRAERLERLGPYVSESGTAVPFSEVKGPYFQSGDFIRLRELSASVTLPASIAQRFRATGASFTVSGRNIALWTDYPGQDPEVLSAQYGGSDQFIRVDLSSLPQPQRWSARLNFQF